MDLIYTNLVILAASFILSKVLAPKPQPKPTAFEDIDFPRCDRWRRTGRRSGQRWSKSLDGAGRGNYRTKAIKTKASAGRRCHGSAPAYRADLDHSAATATGRRETSSSAMAWIGWLSYGTASRPTLVATPATRSRSNWLNMHARRWLMGAKPEGKRSGSNTFLTSISPWVRRSTRSVQSGRAERPHGRARSQVPARFESMRRTCLVGKAAKADRRNA